MTEPQRWEARDAAAFLAAPTADSHKYSRGVLGLSTGSAAYPGAAVLGAEAAWRTGVGLVTFVPSADRTEPHFGLPTPAAAVLAARPETVVSADTGRCDAWVIGSGTDPAARSEPERERIAAILAGTAPVVIDAGALDLATGSRAPHERPSAPRIVTPHAGEFRTLWLAAGLGAAPDLGAPVGASDAARPDDAAAVAARAEAAATLATRLGAAVLLKGSVTLAAAPTGRVLRTGPATPWLATAGTGDVLAGILGALTAGNATAVRAEPELLADLGATAALLHDTAARIAAGDPARESPSGRASAGRPITALDVAHALPDAVERLRERGAALG